jgi:Ser/Thr protein kinase RdoA (MazF antagonist)
VDSGRLDAVLALWGRAAWSAERLPGGWNSTTWLVRASSPDGRPEQYVAKLADTGDGDAFRGGLRVAREAARRGFLSGAPVPARDGRLSVDLPEGVLALLEYVPGRPADPGSRADMRRAGAVLARSHRAAGPAAEALAPQHRWPWAWAEESVSRLPAGGGLRTAARRALDDARQVTARRALRLGAVHGDPGPDAFRLHGTPPHEDGLIDWGAAMEAPLLYDLACVAVLTRGTPGAPAACTAGYRQAVPEADAELRHLDALVRLRWLCHAVYFAARLERGTVRGPGGEEANRAGLAEAAAHLAA